MLTKVQILYKNHKEKVALLTSSDAISADNEDRLIRELIDLDSLLMAEPAICLPDVAIKAKIAEYWRDPDDDDTTLNGFDAAVAVATAQFVQMEGQLSD